MTLDKRLCALERASPDEPRVLLVDFVRPGDVQPRLVSATIGGTVMQRLDEEGEETFKRRVEERTLRTCSRGGVGIAFLRRGDR